MILTKANEDLILGTRNKLQYFKKQKNQPPICFLQSRLQFKNSSKLAPGRGKEPSKAKQAECCLGFKIASTRVSRSGQTGALGQTGQANQSALHSRYHRKGTCALL